MTSGYRDLRVWQQGMQLAREVYLATESFPRREQFGLTAQIRRSAVSVPSNIAEGKGRQTDKDYANFLFHARGSLLELETQLTLAVDLGFLEQAKGEQLLAACAKLGSGLTGLINSLRSSLSASASS